MKVSLDIRKSVDENAAAYFEKAKKERKKIEGAKAVIEDHEAKLHKANAEVSIKAKPSLKKRKTEWYEKFRWFISSDDFVVIGGRDATTNEIVVKKHAEEGDLVFHTDMAGSPFVVVKRDGKEDIPDTTLDEAASFTAAFSRGWKQGMATIPVFFVQPSQLSKTPNTGEFIAKGAFIVRGQTNYRHPNMEFAIGMADGKIMGGPPSAVLKHCQKIVKLTQGSSKPGDLAKELCKKIGGDLDEIIRVLPQGCRIEKER